MAHPFAFFRMSGRMAAWQALDDITICRLFVHKPKSSLGLAWILLFRRVDFVWLLISNSELLRIKNGQKTPYKKQKTASSHKKIK